MTTDPADVGSDRSSGSMSDMQIFALGACALLGSPELGSRQRSLNDARQPAGSDQRRFPPSNSVSRSVPKRTRFDEMARGVAMSGRAPRAAALCHRE
jgi:hypothetical protein